MSDSESDEDLRRAIALSLQESTATPPPHNSHVIDLISSDDEDDDLDAPVSTNKGVSSSHQAPNDLIGAAEPLSGSPFTGAVGVIGDGIPNHRPSKSPHAIETISQTLPDIALISEPPSTKSSLLGLDRKQMEEERRQRAMQRTIGKDVGAADQSRKRKPSNSPPVSAFWGNLHLYVNVS